MFKTETTSRWGGARPNSGPKRHIPTARPDTAHWYCARTPRQGEADAAAEIGAAGFDVFLPTIAKPATRARRNAVGAIVPARPATTSPLFGNYVFARFRLTEYWRERENLPSVETLLGLAPGAPTPVPDRAIDLIRGMCDADGCFHERGELPNSLVGKMLRLLDGPFASFAGVCDWSQGDKAQVTIAAFGRQCPVTVKQSSVEIA